MCCGVCLCGVVYDEGYGVVCDTVYSVCGVVYDVRGVMCVCGVCGGGM